MNRDKDKNLLLSEKNLSAAPAVIAVCGAKNTGKTTLLEAIIPLLCQKGLRLAVIKHDSHDFVPDVPGTDSYRFRQAGANGVAVFSRTKCMTIQETENAAFGDVIAAFNGMDLILLEGGKATHFPKIEVARKAIGEAIVADAATLLAVYADFNPWLPGVLFIESGQYDRVAEIILYQLEAHKSSRM